MKKLLLPLLGLLFYTCSNNNGTNPNCNFLLDVDVDLTVNLNLPQFNQLQFAGNAVKVDGFGNGGIILVRANANAILAWDASDPNQIPSACSSMTVSGLNAESQCGDGNVYNLITGQLVSDTNQPCTLKPYRVDPLGNNSYLITN